jgi:hypothetical protein
VNRLPETPDMKIVLILATLSLQAAYAQSPGGNLDSRPDRISTAIGTNRVIIRIAGGERIIQANGWPDHVPGAFPRRGNPNSIATQNYNLQIPVNPQIAPNPTKVHHGLVGIALNGIPFDPATAEFWNNDPGSGWNYEAKSGFIDLGLDRHNAHVQPNGAYHYHGLPTGLVEKLGGEGSRMVLVGYAADGFPLYTAYGFADAQNAKSALKKMRSSYRLKNGIRPNGPGGKYDGKFTEDYEYVKGSGDLDECNGRFGVTPEYPKGIYHYYLTEEFPCIARQLRGTPDPSFQRKPPPPGFQAGRRPPPPNPARL